jgi:hypothetical protein
MTKPDQVGYERNEADKHPGGQRTAGSDDHGHSDKQQDPPVCCEVTSLAARQASGEIVLRVVSRWGSRGQFFLQVSGTKLSVGSDIYRDTM